VRVHSPVRRKNLSGVIYSDKLQVHLEAEQEVKFGSTCTVSLGGESWTLEVGNLNNCSLCVEDDD